MPKSTTRKPGRPAKVDENGHPINKKRQSVLTKSKAKAALYEKLAQVQAPMASAPYLNAESLSTMLKQTDQELAGMKAQIQRLEKFLAELQTLQARQHDLLQLRQSLSNLLAPRSITSAKQDMPTEVSTPSPSLEQSADTAITSAAIAEIPALETITATTTSSVDTAETETPKRRPGRPPRSAQNDTKTTTTTRGRKPKAVALLDEPVVKRGPGRPKRLSAPKNLNKGDYAFLPELAYEQSKSILKRRESVNFELFKAIVLHGGVANSEQIRQYLIDNDIRQPHKNNESFEGTALTDISSRVSYLIRKGAVQPRGNGLFASAFGWQKASASSPTTEDVTADEQALSQSSAN